MGLGLERKSSLGLEVRSLGLLWEECRLGEGCRKFGWEVEEWFSIYLCGVVFRDVFDFFNFSF